MAIVIRHKVASPTHTDGSIVFNMWRLCAPEIYYTQSAFAPYRCCPLLSCFEYRPSDMFWAGFFRPQNCPFTFGDLDPI